MSIVTTVIVVHGEYTPDVGMSLSDPDADCASHFWRLRAAPDETAGGYKVPENAIMWAAVNHLKWDAYVERFRSYPWKHPGEACLILASSDLRTTEVYRVDTDTTVTIDELEAKNALLEARVADLEEELSWVSDDG